MAGWLAAGSDALAACLLMFDTSDNKKATLLFTQRCDFSVMSMMNSGSLLMNSVSLLTLPGNCLALEKFCHPYIL